MELTALNTCSNQQAHFWMLLFVPKNGEIPKPSTCGGKFCTFQGYTVQLTYTDCI